MRLVALLPKHHGETIDSQDDYTDVDSFAFYEYAILNDIDVDSDKVPYKAVLRTAKHYVLFLAMTKSSTPPSPSLPLIQATL